MVLGLKDEKDDDEDDEDEEAEEERSRKMTIGVSLFLVLEMFAYLCVPILDSQMERRESGRS